MTLHHTDVPSSYRHRIAEIATVCRCIGLKIDGAPTTGSKAYKKWFFEEIIAPISDRASIVITNCQKQEFSRSPLLQEILRRDGKRYVVTFPEALKPESLEFWQGRIFARDITIALPIAMEEFLSLPLLSYVSDPFVMQNLRSFMGPSGTRLVSDALKAVPGGVVVSFVGGANEVFVFSNEENLRRLVPIIFEKCRISKQYLNYANGSFLPLDQVLISLRPIV